ncbi:MAG: hypothetical protein GYA55_14910, partial [SAR324 cluster bacterium]|nr:hypothetical protein [SAR324 cluster bacterium]
MTYFSGQSRGISWTNGRLRAMLIRLSIVALFLSICILLVFVVFSPDAKRLQIASLFPEYFRRQRVVVEPQKQATIVKADVLVATETIPTGTRLRPNMFKIELRPI